MSPEDLPDDPVLLREMLVAQNAELANTKRVLSEQLARNERLEYLISQLQRIQFGRKSEKLDPDQLNLALDDIDTAIAEVFAEEEKADPKARKTGAAERRAARPSLPDHLPQVEVVIEPESTACPCCGGAMHRIGEDCSKRLDVIPAQYRVLVTRRPKYACRACEGAIVQASAPARLIEGGLPTEQLVAQVIVAKYADHSPLYRQCQAMARQGIVIDRSTLASWVGFAAAELKPVWRCIRDNLLSSTKLFVDETEAPVLDPGRGRTKTGYFWAIARDDRPWGSKDPPVVVYIYAPGRGAKHVATMLEDFTGILQTDGYQAYKTLVRQYNNAIALAHCWAHVRRKFFDISKKSPAPIADQALNTIAQFYKVEAEVRGQSAESRRAVRQEKTRPLAEGFKEWCLGRLNEVSGKSNIAEALRYVLSHWEGLTRFLDDGRIEIDSNTVERSIRPIALNRKNALFAGHDAGAENWALLASLIENCKLNDVNPAAYLADVLTKLVNNWPNSRLAELTPWAWAAANPRKL